MGVGDCPGVIDLPLRIIVLSGLGCSLSQMRNRTGCSQQHFSTGPLPDNTSGLQTPLKINEVNDVAACADEIIPAYYSWERQRRKKDGDPVCVCLAVAPFTGRRARCSC